MSGKTLIFLALVGAAGYALTRARPPVPPTATAADSVAISQAGIGARFQYGIGALGAKMVGGSVRGSVEETEAALLALRPGIKKARGGDAARAVLYAKKIVVMDSTALEDLYYGRPVSAVRNAMEGKSLLNAVHEQIVRGF